MSLKTEKNGPNEKLETINVALEEEKRNSEMLLTQLKYIQADLENLQKRTQKRINEAVDRTSAQLLEKLLPILDELELAICAAKKSNKNILEGVKMMSNKLKRLIESEGVSAIKAIDKPFNPNYHEAIIEVETSDYPEGYIAEEIRKGYTYKGRVLRTSLVKVARNPNSEEIKREVKND